MGWDHLPGYGRQPENIFSERKMSRICYTVCLNRFNHKQRPTGQFQTNTARKSYIFFYNIYLWPLAPCPLETTSSPYFSSWVRRAAERHRERRGNLGRGEKQEKRDGEKIFFSPSLFSCFSSPTNSGNSCTKAFDNRSRNKNLKQKISRGLNLTPPPPPSRFLWLKNVKIFSKSPSRFFIKNQ